MSALPPAPAVVVTAPRAPVTVADLVEMATISSLSISPDGKWVAFRVDQARIASNTVGLRWYVVPLDGSQPARLVGDGGEAHFDTSGIVVTEAPTWSPASNAIYYRALIGGESQLWRAPVDGSGAARLTADPANIRTIALDPDGRAIRYTVDATRAAIAQAESDNFDQGAPGDGSADLHKPASRGYYADGQLATLRATQDWYAYGHLLWQTPTRTVRVPLPAGDQGPPPSSAPTAIDWTIRWEPAHAHWRLMLNRPGGTAQACTAALCAVRSPTAVIRLPGRTDDLVTLRNRAQEDLLALWDPVDQSMRVIARAPGSLTGSDSDNACAAAHDAVVCVVQGPASPPRLMRIGVPDGEQRTLFVANPGLAARITTPVRHVIWHDARGVEHSARLVLPTGPKPAGGYPLVFTYYSCAGFLRGGTGGELPLIPLAEHGIAAMCITRAHTDYKHQDATIDEARALEDIKAVTGLLVREGLVDRRRIGEWGYSFGGQVLEQVLLRTDLLAAAADASNITDPTAYWFFSLPGRDFPDYLRTRFKYGDPDRDPASWRARSLTFHIDRVRVPLLLQPGEGEARASIHFWSKLAATRTPAELWAFPNEPHTKIFPRHQAIAMTRNLDWFRYWLDGARDPEPAKQAQYARWDALDRRWKGGGHGTRP